jgi:predicted helicase
VLDLHGNSKKNERSPDGTKDENVFDIQQGVAFGIFVKRKQTRETSHQNTVRHADLWGMREVYEKTDQKQHLVGGKYYWLARHDLTTTEWTMLDPQSPFYLFIPQNSDLKEEYENGWKVTDIMPTNASTITSGRNELLIAFDEKTLKERMADFVNPNITDNDLKDKYFLGVINISAARAAARADTAFASRFRKLSFRPFDIRYTFYADYVTERPRTEIMRHMLHQNLSLLTHRPQSPREFTYVYCTTLIADQCVAANKSSGGGNSFQFPLYLYPDPKKPGLFDTDEVSSTFDGRHPNLSPPFITDITKKLNLKFIQDGKGDLELTFGPEDIFDYMYAVFHSPTYRSRYAEFLKIDFPRLPLTSDADLFRALCILGDRLVGLHLREKYAKHTPKYPEPGNNVVETVAYNPAYR